METNFSAQLGWNKGITFSNTALDLPIFLPERLKFNLWEVKKLKSLLQAPYFAVIQVVNGSTADLMDVAVLRTYGSDSQRRTYTLAYNDEKKLALCKVLLVDGAANWLDAYQLQRQGLGRL